MIYVDDNAYDGEFFEAANQQFAATPELANCANKRYSVCLNDTASWVALCLYLREQGGSVFPLPIGTPLEAAQQRAIKSDSHYLIYGENLTEALANISEISARELDKEAVLVQMSSGTTGEPKVISRSWESIAEELASYVSYFTEPNEMTPIVACPVTHSYGLICGVLVALERGIAPRIISNLNPKYVLRKMLEADKPLLYTSPALLSTLVMLTPANSPLYAVMTSGVLMQEMWFEKAQPKITHFYQQYGCSEAGCISIAKDIAAANDIGFVLPHLQLSTGENAAGAAEIVVTRSNGTAINTADLAYTDERGSIRYISRMDDMINVSGQNVYPKDVEDAVMDMLGIEEAVAFKLPHNFGGERVALHFVADKPIADDKIREWCAECLAPHQIPMHIEQVDSIAKLPNGKISRKNLTALATA